MKLLTFLLTYILIQFVKPGKYTSVCLLVYLFYCLFVYLFICLFVYLFPDCTEPPTLQNGASSGCLSEGGQYQFSCDYPYTLNGRMTRLCLDGRWTGVQPTCELVPSE